MNSDNRDIPGEQAPDPTGELGKHLPPLSMPDRLQHRVMASLVEQKLIRPLRPRWQTKAPRIMAAVALAAACFVAGLSLGKQPLPPLMPGTDTREFALLLYAAPGNRPESTVQAHRSWAAHLVREGHQLSGKKLSPEATVLQQSAGDAAVASGLMLTGFFVISARNADEALAIARSMPHFLNGGQVVVRPIDPT